MQRHTQDCLEGSEWVARVRSLSSQTRSLFAPLWEMFSTRGSRPDIEITGTAKRLSHFGSSPTGYQGKRDKE